MKLNLLVAAVATAQAVKLSHKDDNAKLKGEIQPLQWCPDYDERHVLQDGNTPAVPWPEKGFNCKTFHHVLGPNKSPYSQEPAGWQ